jgi:chaperonin GroES
MATEMPIEQDYQRYIDGLSQAPEGEVETDLPEGEMDVEELPDGSAVVTTDDFSGPEEDEDFYQNLAEVFDPYELNRIAMHYIDLVENDKQSREERDKQYEEGLKRTGLGKDAPGGANFLGASKVVHPIMAEACVDFASRAIKEMFPPDGPTRTKIIGDVDKKKVEVAERKRDYMNWQLTEQIEEFRDEQEQLLTQLPLGGSQYLKMWYDEGKKRPCTEFVPIDNIYLPYASGNFYTAQRVTEVNTITSWEFQRRVDLGLYRDINLIRASAEPEMSYAEKANTKIEGKKFQDNDDGVRNVFHIYTWLEMDEDKRTKGETAPYILMVDELDMKVVGLYRNWEEGDETMTKLDWLIEFKFIPWRGAYAIGLPHLIGGLSAALTGSLRALLDSAHINNSATMLKIKGARMSGQTQQVEVTQVAEIEGAPGVDDVRKIAMPMPFNPPSQVLMELLGWLTDAAKGVVSTSEEKIADATNNMPVGTAQALIEQGAHVYSAIHARLHESQARVLKVLGRLNRWYLDDQRRGEMVADLDIHRDDFKRNTDVIPVSDPHIFSETQRMAQTQAVMQIMAQYPQAFNQKAVLERFLKQMKIPQINELMIMEPTEDMIDSSQENVLMMTGQPAKAYEEQDHLAHIQSHLDFYQNPVFGGANPLIMPALIQPMVTHIQEHFAMWYQSRMNEYVETAMRGKAIDYDDPKVTSKADKLYALASQHVQKDSEQVFANVMPIFQQMMQQIQQLKQQAQPPMDADAQALVQTSMAETQRRAKKDQVDAQLAQAKLQTNQALEQAKLKADADRFMAEKQMEVAMSAEDNLTRERIESAKLTHEGSKLQQEQVKTALGLENQAQNFLGGQNVK